MSSLWQPCSHFCFLNVFSLVLSVVLSLSLSLSRCHSLYLSLSLCHSLSVTLSLSLSLSHSLSLSLSVTLSLCNSLSLSLALCHSLSLSPASLRGTQEEYQRKALGAFQRFALSSSSWSFVNEHANPPTLQDQPFWMTFFYCTVSV